ncbi:DNA (cytosine-5-)-methyltransferase [Hyphobacterium marinum]|uniref:Cytosine-specific methyltransferase n=1 Tax=Hyphobacterium marinum TaxID=3116574 RepID=A0ABU7LW93_9PROT|nr:DNA (cytosine-5-)-methyltransferase [Hyphobacterium sp. Y6023]MEE2565465.1 DNA (cytosine-5-)-methyltransferase [Hyphobacterium sp. Y6023]
MTEFITLMDRAGLSREDAAKTLDVCDRTILRYLNKKAEPSRLAIEKLETLAAARRSIPAVHSPDFRFIDLFAGIGGLRLGFEAINGKCVFTSEWDKHSQRTYAANFYDGKGHQSVGDIRPYGEDPSKIPAHDVLLAGFPCQPFSLAGVSKKNALGRPHGFEDETQGTLFFDVARIIKHHQPAAFLLENVKNLQSHDRGKTFAVIMRTLTEELGYHVEYKVVSATPWVPQKRERIFLVGFRDSRKFKFDGFEKQVPDAQCHPVLGDILQSHNEIGQKYTLTENLWDYLQAYRAKHEGKGNGFGYSLFGPDDVARTLSARYHKDGSEILIDQPHGPRPRRLTPTECARLMGFEHGGRKWTIPVSDTQAYRQFGNAVVVPAVEAIARHMEQQLREDLGLPERPLSEAA